jgi:C-terminal processing protease CtpA/Prc
VIAGGPADEAGMHTGDRILAIDGIPTSKLVLPEIRERMRRGAIGSKVQLLVESAGTRREVVVTLRDLV